MAGSKGTRTSTPQGGVARHGAAIFDEAPHDPYQARGKYAEPSRCGDCGAVYHRGRWQWSDAPPGAETVLCPACHRIRDRLPAGTLVLEGAFVDAHRDEIAGLLRHEESRAKSQHPLDRVVEVAHSPERITVTTTDIHLPRRIGVAMKRAYRGQLAIEYAKGAYEVRVRWRCP
jgi:hypothetical protein